MIGVNRRDKKGRKKNMGERKIREKMMFSFIWFRRENSKDRKQIFILPIWEKN